MAATEPRYIIPDDLISRLANLATDYLGIHFKGFKDSEKSEKIKNDFANAKPLGTLSAPGTPDFYTRRNQISFLFEVVKHVKTNYPASIKEVFPVQDEHGDLDSDDDLSESGNEFDEKSDTIQQRYMNYMKGRFILVCAAMFVMNQIAGTYKFRSEENSTLYSLLAQAIGVKSYHAAGRNKPSKHDYKLLYLSAKQIWKELGIKQEFTKERAATCFEDYRQNFSNFINEEIKKYAKPDEWDLPLTKLIVPVTTKGFQWLGWSLGFSIAREASHTTPVLPTIATTTSALVLASQYASYSSGALVAFSAATAIVQSSMIIFSAALMGELVKYVGTGIGYGIGLTADVAWKGVKALFHMLKDSIKKKELDSRLENGLDVTNQQFVLTPPLTATELEQKHHLSINVSLGEKEIHLSMAGQVISLGIDTLGDEETFMKAFAEKVKELTERPAVVKAMAEYEKMQQQRQAQTASSSSSGMGLFATKPIASSSSGGALDPLLTTP